MQLADCFIHRHILAKCRIYRRFRVFVNRFIFSSDRGSTPLGSTTSLTTISQDVVVFFGLYTTNIGIPRDVYAFMLVERTFFGYNEYRIVRQDGNRQAA